MSATLPRSAALLGLVLLVVALAPLAGRGASVSAQAATVSAVTVASSSRTAATATATVSGAGTFSLRFSARGENAWGTSLTATATAAGDVTFALTGLAPNDYYDVQVSGDSTFATGVVSRTFQNRPAHLDIALERGTGSNVATGIAGDANTLWVIADGARGVTTKIHAYKRTLAAQHGDRDTAKDMTPHSGNHTPGGAWSDGTFLYVVDRSQGRIYVYSLADGSRELSREFRFERGHLDQWGAWANDDTFWVVKRQHDALAYKRPPLSGYMAARDTAKDITLHEHGSYALGGLWSDGETLWAVDGRDRVLYAFDLRLGVPRPHLDVPLNSGHVTAINGLGASGIWGDGEYFWVLDLRLNESKVFTYYQPQPDPSVTELSVVSATSSVVTVRAEMTYPDVSRTVHLRHREPFAATWSTTSGTGGRTIDFVLVRPASAPRLVVQASLDSTFSDGTEVTAELLVRPAQRDFALPGNRTINGIWTDGTTLWVVGEPTLGRSLASGIRLSNQQLVGRFDLESENSAPVGVYATSTHVWVVDAQDKVYVYRIRDGRYESWNSFEIVSGNSQLRGAWSNGTTMWIADHVREHVFAYKMGDDTRGAREITKEADLATSYAQPRGMWSNGSTLWVVDAALDRIYAYAISSGGVGGRQPAREVNLVRENGAPWGIAASGNTAWVYDQVKRKVFAYYLPPALGGTITDVQFGEPGVTTASVTVTIANPDSESQTVALKYRAQPDGADQSVSMTTTGASFTFEFTGLTPDTLYSLLVTQGADTALHTPGFKTQSEPEQRAHYLKTNVVAVHRADNPWVVELYDQMRRLNLLIRATVGGSQVFLDCRGVRVEGLPICDVVSIDIGDGRHRANAGVWLHEMGHVYNAGSRYMGADSEGRGIAWLYFEKLAADGSGCRVHELYADAVESGTVAGSLSNYFPACANTGDTPSAATLALIQSVLAKTMPAWFDTTYEDDTVAYDTSTDPKYDKTYDLEQVWTDLLAMDGWRTSAVFALRNAFGGYCDPIRTIEAQLPSTLNPTRNPWRAGGCVPQPPAAVTLATDGQVTWEAPPYDGGNDLRLYIVEWKDYGEEYDESRAGKVRDLMGTLVYATPATAPGSSVRVSAFSYGGLSEAAEQRQPAAAPGAPAVSAVIAGDGALTVQWSAPASSGGADITSYDVRSILSTASDKADANWDVIGAWTSGDTAGDLEYTITSLTNGDSHDVEVRAVNSAGNGVWSTTGMVGIPLSTDNTLSALSVGGARLSPTFTSAVTSYTASVGYTVMQITVTATENDAGATATLESPADSDPVTAGFQVNLSEGPNDILIKVTAANGDTRTYTVTVTRTGQVTSLTPPASDPVAPFASEAAYTLTFQGAWTTAVTPDGVPGGAHFSRLAGAVHNAGVTFLASGGTASAGVESMAETGAIATLESEVQTAIDADPATALSVLRGSTDTGGVEATQTLNPTLSTAHPRVTLVTMVAPSPDWFVGVSGLPLLNSSGRWLRSHTVNLYPWDAGTEDGTDFSLNNADTDPKVPIHSIRGTGKFSTEPIATLSFELQEVSTTRTVAENTPRNSNIGPPITAAATAGATTYTLGGADAASFTIVATSGQLRTQAALDYEAGDTYEVDVTAMDANGSAVTRVTVDVTNVDEPAGISFSAGSSVTVNNNALTVDENHDGTLATFRARDPENDQTLTYRWSTDPPDHFVIAAGVLSFKNIPDYELPAGGTTSYDIAVSALDSGGMTGSIAVTVTVTNVDEPPEITLASAAGGAVTVSGSAVSVDENHAGDLVNVTATDPESTHTDYTLALGGTHSTSFTLNTGVLSFTNPPDHEARVVYDLTLTASNASESSTLDVTVTVRDVDEPADITFSEGSNVTANDNALTVDENYAGSLATFSASDPEMKPGLTYQWSVVGTDGGDFAFTAEADTRSGELSFAANPDYERPADSVGNNVYDITVNARDSDNKTGRINVTVTVLPVNEPPIISGEAEVNLNEVVDPTPGQVVRVDTYTKSDPDRPVQTTNWGPIGSTTVLSGDNADVFDFDLPTRALTFKRPPDYENGGGRYQVTLTANDGAKEATLDVTVNVANVEEAGTLALGARRGVFNVPLVATLEDPDVVATQTWKWQRSTSLTSSWMDIANADSNSYTPGADDRDNYLRASVTYTDGTGPDETTLTADTEFPTDNNASTNQPPTPPDPLPQVAAVPEDAPAGRNVVQVVFTDPEGEQELTYSLSGSDEFAIGSGSGRITVKSGELNYEVTTSYSVTVSAADSLGAAGMVTLTIGISDVDEPPGITLASAAGSDVTVSGSAVSVDENHAGDLVDVTATDPESTHTDYTLALGGIHATSFTLNSTGATGVLSFTNPPDHEVREVYRLTLTASNASESSTLAVTVTVGDVNEPADISFVASGGVTVNDNALTVDENHDGTLATFSARDPESKAGLTYEWSVDMTDHFAINAGVLSFVGIPDFEDPAGGTNVYDITVSALDSDGETGSIAVTVTVEDVDEPADISFVATGNVTANGNALTVDENHDGRLATFRADDPESTPGLTYQWALEGTDRSHFAITAAGEFSFLNIPDYERPAGGKKFYNITVQATDSAPTPLTGRIAVTVTVEGVDEPPTITGDAARSIEEGGATLVGTYGATDPESATIAWQPLAGSDADEFEFTSSNGRLAFKEAPDFEDAERGGDNEYNVTLGVSAGSHTITFDVVVTVTNKEEQGTLLLSSPQPQVEAAFTATLTDPDIVGATTWKWERSMSSGGGWQPIDGATAASYTPVVGDIDYYLHATATYTDGYSANKSLSAVSANRVEAKPLVNTAPEFPPGPTTRSVPEDARANATVGAPVVAADAEHAGQLTYTLTGSDLFTIDGGSGQIRVAADESLDHETALSHSVMVTATDPSLALDTVQVTIDVTNVNEPPNAVADAPGRFDEDTSIEIRVLDNDSDPEDERSELLLTVVTPPSNGSATVNEPAHVGDNRTITYEPNANYHGADSFTYQVTDSGGLSSTARVTVQITPVNDPPEFATDMTTRTVSEGAGPGDTVGTKVAATDVDDSTLTYRLSGASDFVIDASGPTAGQIRVAPGVTLDRENTPSYQVTVTATDRLNASDTIAVTINLDNVNDPPVAESDTATTNEDMSVNIDVLDNDTDPDTDRARLRVSVLTQPLNGTARAQSDQTITYTPNANFAGPNSFTYRLSDGQFTDDGSVSVTVVAVNDAPTFFPTTAARSVPEDAEAGDNVGPAVTATDVEGDTLSYYLSGADASSFEINSEGQITVATGVTFDITMKPAYTVTVEADDGTDTATVVVTITVGGAAYIPPSSGGGGGGGFAGGGGGGGGGPSPSVVDFEWSVTRDIEDLGGGHDKPSGTWSDGTTLWVLENGSGADDAIYAYDLKTGERVEDREFELDETNRAPRSVWSDRTVLWVSDSGQEKLFAHDLESGERLPERDIALADRNRDARGIWSDDATMWVLDGGKESLFAYDLASGELAAEYALDDANDDPRGLFFDGVTFWVSDHGEKRIFAYRLEAGEDGADGLERNRDEEFPSTVLSRAGNNSPRGLWSDGDVMYVADESDARVYTYNMPDSIDARLSSLTLSGVDIGEFDRNRTDYEGAADEGVTETTVTAEAMQRRTDVAIDPPDIDEAAEGYQVALEDLGEITVTVTSADGSREKTYRVRLAQEEAAGPAPECLRGAVAVGFSLIVYAGGSIEDLVACAEGRNVAALYTLDSGEWVSYIVGAPELVNRSFAGLFADGVPALTPLIARSDGPATADPDPSGDEPRTGDATQPWPACLQGEIAKGFNLVVYEGGSVGELEACAEGVGLAALYALSDGVWVSYIVGAPEFVNRSFAGLFADGVPSATPLVGKRD